MNKSALKTFATSARKELLKKVEAKAMKIGITEDNIKKTEIESSDAIYIDGKQLSKEEKVQRDRLIERINQIGFKRVMEEVAYTWFNRFTALRYMEVNEYLPTDVRVLSSTNPNSADPDMINEALSLDLEIDKEYVYDLKLNNKTEELFKYLIIKHCNDLNRYLPFMFEKIDDYTEILFPEGLLAKDSFIREITDIKIIPEDNWQKVEVIGWLYQYYIAEEKDRVIHAKKKYKTEEIPFATQLFTPDWIVRYMVQNSLGRYWLEAHPEHQELLSNWEFYLENQNPGEDFEGKLAPYINKELRVEDIKCFDPAMGSGHILVYIFDVLYEIYSKCGYMEREIPRLILENNLYGLDIDDRAYQLACFSVVMKALEYNSRFFRSIEREGLVLNLASVQETNMINEEDIVYFAGVDRGVNFDKTKDFINLFENAKTIGSLIKVDDYDEKFFYERLNFLKNELSGDLFEETSRQKVLNYFPSFLKQAKIMTEKYDVLVTNPPYMGNKYMNKTLSDYMNKYYSESKSDLFSAFIYLCLNKVSNKGLIGLLTPLVWMFISSYEQLRSSIINRTTIDSLIQLEYNSFSEATVPVCTFVLRNYATDINGEYIRLADFTGADNQPKKTLEAIKNPNVDYRYTCLTTKYEKVKGNPIIYWASDSIFNAFESPSKLSKFGLLNEGLKTRDNERFLRLWFEVDFSRREKWKPYSKGGGFKKWYGNNEYVVNWEFDGKEVKGFKKSSGGNFKYFFKETLTWSAISSYKFSVRYINNSIFGGGGSGIVNIPEDKFHILLALLNSNIANEILNMLSSTLNYEVGNVAEVPVLLENLDQKRIDQLTRRAVEISKEDWDSSEKSWDFKMHPLLNFIDSSGLVEKANQTLNEFKEERFLELKSIEEEINRHFIDAYGLVGEYSPQVDEDDITISKGDSVSNIKSFISYAVGCLLGRYSLDNKGIVFAGGKFNYEGYKKFPVDNDNILPILPGTYFEDDIVSKVINFVKLTFGEERLSENLEFIATILGKKKGETPKETIRRYFLNEFFADHLSIYSSRGRKAPIYWLFTSGKQKAFNCLIYMQRYDKTTLSRIRTDYLHEYQNRLDGERKSLLNIIEGDSTTKEISNAKKELKVLDKRIEELKEYDELLHHMADMQIEIDLDNGVVFNYEKFNGLVAKI